MGVKISSYMNSFLTLVNLGVMVVIVVAGYYYGNSGNWSGDGGFMPFGATGVIAGAATCFYAYVGFDSIATSGEEANDPAYSIPVATIIAMSVVCTGPSYFIKYLLSVFMKYLLSVFIKYLLSVSQTRNVVSRR